MQDLWPYILLGLLGVGCYNALQYLAVKTSTPINVTLVASSMPVFMLVLGALTQIIPNDWFDRLEAYYDRASIAMKVTIPFVVIFVVAVAAPGGVPPFIYFQF